MSAVKGMVDGTEVCPYFSERKAVPGLTSLKAQYPMLAQELDNDCNSNPFLYKAS